MKICKITYAMRDVICLICNYGKRILTHKKRWMKRRKINIYNDNNALEILNWFLDQTCKNTHKLIYEFLDETLLFSLLSA